MANFRMAHPSASAVCLDIEANASAVWLPCIASSSFADVVSDFNIPESQMHPCLVVDVPPMQLVGWFISSRPYLAGFKASIKAAFLSDVYDRWPEQEKYSQPFEDVTDDMIVRKKVQAPKETSAASGFVEYNREGHFSSSEMEKRGFVKDTQVERATKNHNVDEPDLFKIVEISDKEVTLLEVVTTRESRSGKWKPISLTIPSGSFVLEWKVIAVGKTKESIIQELRVVVDVLCYQRGTSHSHLRLLM